MTFSSKDIHKITVDSLIERRVLPHSEGLMLVEVHFKKGGVGHPHAHDDHEQISYVLSGSFESIIDGKKKILREGDGFVADKRVSHGLTALEDSVVLDVFTPIRKDFL